VLVLRNFGGLGYSISVNNKKIKRTAVNQCVNGMCESFFNLVSTERGIRGPLNYGTLFYTPIVAEHF